MFSMKKSKSFKNTSRIICEGILISGICKEPWRNKEERAWLMCRWLKDLKDNSRGKFKNQDQTMKITWLCKENQNWQLNRWEKLKNKWKEKEETLYLKNKNWTGWWGKCKGKINNLEMKSITMKMMDLIIATSLIVWDSGKYPLIPSTAGGDRQNRVA